MMKRTQEPNFYGQTKKFRVATPLATPISLASAGESKQFAVVDSINKLPTDTDGALHFLKQTFPVDKFTNKLPPVILVHQVYSIIKNKTKVDHDIIKLQAKGIIRLFKLGGEEEARVLVYHEDLLVQAQKCCPDKSIIKRFLNEILLQVNDVGIEKEFLQKEYHITEQQISDLVNVGLLTMRSANSYWFSFPNAGEFMRTYLKGRKCILRTIKKSKFSEILQNELEKRNLEKSAKLGIMYHIYDIIGAELVTCIETTSGTLLRLEKQKK